VEVEERGGMAALTAGAVRVLQARGWDHRLTDLTLNFCTKHLEAEGLLTLVVHHRQLAGEGLTQPAPPYCRNSSYNNFSTQNQ